MKQQDYKKGVYRYHRSFESDVNVVVYFDGKEFWVPGQDGAQTLTDGEQGTTKIDKNRIGELLLDLSATG